MMKVLVFGQGYLGGYVASALPADLSVRGTHRTPSADSWTFSDVEPLPPHAFEGVTHVLITIPPKEEGDIVLHHHHKELSSSSSLRWVGYVSSTSVYGDHQGARVTEESPCHPQTPMGVHRLAAEEAWRSLSLPLSIFRLSGIYGPGRSVFERLGGAKISAPDHLFSRIHVQDAGRLIAAAMTHPSLGPLYNMADQEAAPTSALMDYACSLKGLPLLPSVGLEEATLSPMMQEFYKERKRVDGSLILKDLGLSLLYPTFREGLKDCMAKMPSSLRDPQREK